MPRPSMELQERIGNVQPILRRTKGYVEFSKTTDNAEDFGHLPAQYQKMITDAERLKSDSVNDGVDEIDYFYAAKHRHRDKGEETYSALFEC